MATMQRIDADAALLDFMDAEMDRRLSAPRHTTIQKSEIGQEASERTRRQFGMEARP